MNMDFASALERKGFVKDWSEKICYNKELTDDDKSMIQATDAWIREMGNTGDSKNELAALIRKSLTQDELEYPDDMIERLYNIDAIGEFDDTYIEVEPKNTLVAHEVALGGTADASYIEHAIKAPTWKTLQVETFVTMQDLRRNGYRTVANLVNFAREALYAKRITVIMNALSAAVTNGMANYISEATTLPTATSMDALSLYLNDVSDGSAPMMFGLSKYMQAVGNLDKTNINKTDVEKGLWNNTGYVQNYGGVDLKRYSGQNKYPDGTTVFPDKVIFGAAGKIGSVVMRGETRVLEESDARSEKIYLKVGGYVFGHVLTDITKAAKVVLA